MAPVALLGLLAIGLVPPAPGPAGGRLHAYYLFLAAAPKGCEDCYIPLLIVEQTLEDIAASGGNVTSILITTYERDSIWKVERGVSLAARDVAARERVVRVGGRPYRYQTITPAEVLRLLEKPEGTIPIHRLTPVPDPRSLEDLIAAFRGLQGRPAAVR